MKPYQRQRLVSFIDPAVRSARRRLSHHPIRDRDRLRRRVGQGLSKGTQARLNFLPEQTTDFIFSVFAEEFGFAGSILLLASMRAWSRAGSGSRVTPAIASARCSRWD